VCLGDLRFASVAGLPTISFGSQEAGYGEVADEVKDRIIGKAKTVVRCFVEASHFTSYAASLACLGQCVKWLVDVGKLPFGLKETEFGG
jgi:hypothetical protein